MATINRIKRSETAGNPPTLAQGELAYSALADNGANGGDRLYIGMGTETAGDAVNHVVIGGKFFTDKLDHANGVVTADSALVVDSSKKLDELNVDNVTINGNTVSTTDTNGDLILAPNGTGKAVISGNAFPNTQGIADQYLKTDGAGALSWATIPSGSFTIAGDTGTDVFTTGETLTVVGGADLTSVVTDNTITINADASLARRADVTYVGTTEIALNRASGSQDLTGITGLVLDGSTSGITTLVASADAGEETITLPAATGTVALTNQKLNTFAATSSAELAGVISDETGSGALVFGTSPTLVTPNIGAATADSITGSGALIITAGGSDANVTLAPTGTGSVDVSNKRISSVAEPTQATDAATKSYVDSKASGLDPKESVKAATTTSITLIGLQTVDGVGLSNGDRVLVKDQATASENGIYVADTNSWVRSTDANDSTKVTPGLFTFVEQGDTQADTGWTLATDGVINLNVTDLSFTQFSSAGSVVAGAGLTKTGNTLDVVVGGGVAIVGNTVQLDATVAGGGLTLTSGVLNVVGTTDRIAVAADSIDIASTYVGQASITTVGTLTAGELGSGFTTVAVAQGGTGATSLTARGVVIGNGTSAVSTVVSGTDGSVLMADATGNPYWSNVIDGGTY